jgi:two-component system nitrogen regulation sensor histidine kinase NtrY
MQATGQAWLNLWAGRNKRRLRTTATLGLVALGPLLAVLTYMVLGPLELSNTTTSLRLILLADFVYILTIAALLAHRIARIMAARRAHSAGSRLHLRLTAAFGLIALIPTVLVAIFATLTVNAGLEGWFSDRVRQVVGNSLAAAEAYEQEQRDDLSQDAQALAQFFASAREQAGVLTDGNLRQILNQAQGQIQRGVKEAYIIKSNGDIRARGDRSYLFDYENPGQGAIDTARSGELVLIEDWPNNEFRVLVALRGYADHFLYISRTVDGAILNLLDDTQETVRLYEQLEADRGRLLFEFALLYLGFAMMLVLAAVWGGVIFAERLSRPVGRLAAAAADVGQGNLDTQVKEERGDDEIATLGRVFNQMTRQLKGQRDELIGAHTQTETRRRLFDSVLSSVSAGVIGLDAGGHVDFMNRAARTMLDLHNHDGEGQSLPQVVPEFAPLFDLRQTDHRPTTQGEVKLLRRGKQEALLVRIAERRSDGALEGFVVAFDDVTDLVSAQRMAAWGDVARRIAHEIKNPLTPIQLSAERIKRKFRTKVTEGADDLEQMTDVIVRQTNDLRRIVDEFSKFARMPEPERKRLDLNDLVRGAVLLQKPALAPTDITLNLPGAPTMAMLDDTMIGQALTNLIKNAGEAIESLTEKGPPADYAPKIRVDLTVADHAHITIADNGIGLPADRARLFEPYVTTRKTGTGLGLSIVKKIIEEHGGTLDLTDAPPFATGAHSGAHSGAMAVITLPILPKSED